MVEAAARLRYTCHVRSAIGRFRQNTPRTQQMNEFEQYPHHSPLCQDVTRDGKTVRVEIYEDGKGGWILEVVDQYQTSTVWDVPFPSDQAALEEALRTIGEEGISSLIGDPPLAPASGQPSDAWQMAPLSDEELDELDDFLFVRPALWLGRKLWKVGDGEIIDGLGPDGIAARVLDATRGAVRLQSGYVYHYAFAMLIGVVALMTWFILRGATP